jgi:hypothetical protein
MRESQLVTASGYDPRKTTAELGFGDLYTKGDLDRLQMALESTRAEITGFQSLAPLFEYPARRPKTGGGIDRGRAADHTPHERRDDRVSNGRDSTLVSIEATLCVQGASRERITAVVLAFLEKHHGMSLLRKLLAHDRPSRSGSYYHGVTFHLVAAVELVSMDHL